MFNFFHRHHDSESQALFPVPEPDPFENPLVETDPTQLRQWTSGLPFADPQQLADTVLISLARLNRFPKPVKKRPELMEIYRVPCSRLAQTNLEKRDGVPPATNRRLMHEMATGYLHIVNGFNHSRPVGRQRASLRDAIYHAIKFLAMEYLFACDMYDCRRSVSQRELYRLHTFAEEHGIHQEAVEDTEQTTPQAATISHQFKRILLLILLDPCHLQEREPRLVFDYLNGFANEARLEALSEGGEASGHYVIDRLGEVAPHLYDPQSAGSLTPERFRLLNLLPISQRLRQHLRALEQDSGKRPHALQQLTSKAIANLLRRMLKSWHIRLERDSERHTTSGEVHVQTGVATIHHHLNGEQLPEESEPTGEAVETIDFATAGTLQGSPAGTGHSLQGWRFNQSRSGVALYLYVPEFTQSLVGEIILISKPHAGPADEGKVGIIRRALYRDETLLEVGVQFINGKIVPLTLQPLGVELEEDETAPSYPGLYINLGEVERSSLIVPRDCLQVDLEYRVEEMVPAPTICPVLLSEITDQFERFRIRRA